MSGSIAISGNSNTIGGTTFSSNIDVTGTVTADGLTVDLADNAGVLLQSPNDSSTAFLKFGDSTYSDSGSISYDHFTDAMRFKTVNTERLRVANNGDISFYEDTGTTAKFFWDASAERLGLGTTSPATQSGGEGIHINGSTYAELKFTNSTTGATASDGTSFLSSGVNFLINNREAGEIQFNTSNANRMVIDSSGNLLVGNTVTSPSSNYSNQRGFAYINSTGKVEIATTANDVVMDIGKNNANDGSLVAFRKQGTIVGSIGTEVSDGTTPADLVITAGTINAARLWLKGGDSGLILDGHTNSVLPTDENSYEDNRTDLGSTSYRFKDLYLSGGVYLGGTGAANKLDDYETGTFTPTLDGAGTPTYGARDGRYVKIGDMVFVTLKMTASGITQSSNTITIGGLPFAGGAVADADQRSSGIVEGDWQAMGSYVDVARFRLDTGSTLQGVRDNGSGSAIYWDYNAIGTSIEFNTSLSYKV
jgi:hypothetical protein